MLVYKCICKPCAYHEAKNDDFSQNNVVTVSTVHQAKGLEWPVVFIPSIIKRRFPSLNHGKYDLIIDKSLYDYERYETNLESEYRLLYVAVTRARDYCFMSDFNTYSSGKHTQKSEFMDILEKSKIINNIKIDIDNNSVNDDFYSIPVTTFSDVL